MRIIDISIAGRRFAKRRFNLTLKSRFGCVREYVRYLYTFSEYWDYSFGDSLVIEIVDIESGEVRCESVTLCMGIDVRWRFGNG